MPLFDFECRRCGAHFEALVSGDEQSKCPQCESRECRRLFSPFAGPFRLGLRGAAARRSNATRRAREEQRRERAAMRGAQRER